MSDDVNEEEDLWGAAAEDLEKQREMLKEEAQSSEDSPADAPAATGGGAIATSGDYQSFV